MRSRRSGGFRSPNRGNPIQSGGSLLLLSAQGWSSVISVFTYVTYFIKPVYLGDVEKVCSN